MNQILILNIMTTCFKVTRESECLFEELRLSQDKDLSERQISRLAGISKTTIHNYLLMFKSSGLPWPLPTEYLNEELLSKKLKPDQ